MTRGLSFTSTVNVLILWLIIVFHEEKENVSCTGVCMYMSVCVQELYAFFAFPKMCMELQDACCCKGISLIND